MEQKTALISGGTAGIGFATAVALLQAGWCVAVNGRDAMRGEKALQKLRQISASVIFVQGDVSKVADCEKIVAETVLQWGHLDGLITSAGIYEERLLHEVEEDFFDRMMAINVKGSVFLCRAALPHLRTRQGSIVLVGSDAGLQGNVACSVYGATKGAVVSFTKSLSLEMAPHGVRVNCVCPGDVKTDLLATQIAASGEDADTAMADMALHYPLGRIAEPREIADVIAFLLSAKASFVTGAVWTIDGGLTSW